MCFNATPLFKPVKKPNLVLGFPPFYSTLSFVRSFSLFQPAPPALGCTSSLTSELVELLPHQQLFPSPPFMINYSVNIICWLNRNISVGPHNCVHLLMSVDTLLQFYSCYSIALCCLCLLFSCTCVQEMCAFSNTRTHTRSHIHMVV